MIKIKLILDLDDDVVKNMQGYCDHHGINIEDIITSLFNNFIQEPAELIDGLHSEDGNLDKLNNFSKLLMEYLNEAIYDIEETAKSDEAYETDRPMANVFRALARDHINKPYILPQLYKVYKENN